MHYLKLAIVAVVCNFTALVAANLANIVRDLNLIAREVVTVTVTTTPPYCSAPASPAPVVPGTAPVVPGTAPVVPGTSLVEIQTTPVPAVGSATPVPATPATPIPTGGPIPYPIGSLSSASPVLPSSGLPTPIVGANTTVSTSSLSTTKSVVSSEVLSTAGTTAPSSAPATSSTSAPNGGIAKHANMNGLLLTIALALFGNVALLL